VISHEKKQALEQDQESRHNPQLPSSDKSILGPILGTQSRYRN